jgi:hypothetical protein
MFVVLTVLVSRRKSLSCEKAPYNKCFVVVETGHLCSLVVRVPGYRSRGPGFDSRNY